MNRRPGVAASTNACATNYLIDTDHAIILDVEASHAIRQAEVGASRTMLDRTAERSIRGWYVTRCDEHARAKQ